MDEDFYREAAMDLVFRARCEFQGARFSYRASVRGNPVQPYGASDINLDGFMALHRKKEKFGGDREVLIYDTRVEKASANEPAPGLMDELNKHSESIRINSYSQSVSNPGPAAMAILILENEPRRTEIEQLVTKIMRRPPDFRTKANLTANVMPG